MPDTPVPRLADVPVAAPFYLRRLDKASVWGDPATPPEVRAGDVVRDAFTVADSAQSFFRVETDDDYRRVVLGICYGRCSRNKVKDPFFFVAFRGEELEVVGITPMHIPEDLTFCCVANRRMHFDAPATAEQLGQLCRNAFGVNRPHTELRKAGLTALEAIAKAEGCPAMPDPAGCRAPDCLSLTRAASPGSA